MKIWRRDPFVHAAFPEPALRRLESDLHDLAAATPEGPAPISWELRQVVLEPSAG